MENTDVPVPGVTEMPWRVGRRLGRTLYAHHPDDPDDSVVLGMVDSAALAEHIVVLHNAWLEGALFG